MSIVTPAIQPRNRQPRDWGNFATLLVLPNVTGYGGTPQSAAALEPGDTAFVVGVGRVECDYEGGFGRVPPAVWRVTGTRNILIPVAASTVAAAGTTPVAYGAVYLEAAQVVQARSRALVGAIGGGIATVQVRRQSTGALVAGFTWSTAAALNSQVLAGAVTIAASDWYVFEVVSDTIGAFAVVQGAELFT